PTTLLVTNDFPPRVGGIQRTLEALVRELPPERVGVFCPAASDGGAYDADTPFRVFRQPEAFLWPTRDVASRVGHAARGPGADVARFRPGVEAQDLRGSLGIVDRPVVVCVSRLVPRKGQDVLIRAIPAIRRRVPDATLLIVGGGPYEPKLRALAASAPSGS